MKLTKQAQVRTKVQSLEVGQQFIKKEFIISVWGNSDYFIDRSFDVLFNSVKKSFPEREFRTEKGVIIRIK
jgi:hypothetical protein